MTRRLTFAVAFAGGMVGAAVLPFAVMAGVEGVRLVQGGGGFANPATADLGMAAQVISFGTDPADSGDIRLENATSACWESSPAGTDVCWGVDTNEAMVAGGDLDLNGFDLTLDADGNSELETSDDQLGIKLGGQNVAYFARDTNLSKLHFDGSFVSAITYNTSTGLMSLQSSSTVGATFDSAGVEILRLEQADLTSSCTTGMFKLDTGVTPELCICQATNTWYCIAVTDTTGPAD